MPLNQQDIWQQLNQLGNLDSQVQQPYGSSHIPLSSHTLEDLMESLAQIQSYPRRNIE